MARLEPISRAQFRCAAPGRLRHAPRALLPRHCHREAFVAVVLAGGYAEAGDTGHHRVAAGDVIFHQAFESHLDRFSVPGAEVLVLPLLDNWEGPQVGSIDDPDAIVRASETDPSEALERLVAAFTARAAAAADWPDTLARLLQDDPGIRLADWADATGLHPASLSRGFAQTFGTTPAAYRLAQRTRRAIAAVTNSRAPLSQIAFDCGFADQAHMTRSVARIAGVTPGALREDRVTV